MNMNIPRKSRRPNDRNLSNLTPVLAEYILWHAQCHIANQYQNTTSDYICADAREAMNILANLVENIGIELDIKDNE